MGAPGLPLSPSGPDAQPHSQGRNVPAAGSIAGREAPCGTGNSTVQALPPGARGGRATWARGCIALAGMLFVCRPSLMAQETRTFV